jgi:hypothetical integral membrane protein (TIGR02206 family)
VSDIYDVLFTRHVDPKYLLETFSLPHLVYVTLSIIGAVVAVRWIKGVQPDRAERILRWWSIACFVGWLGPMLLRVTTDAGSTFRINLPLHVCSAMAIVIPIAVWTKNKTLLNLTYALSVPGAAAAVLMPEALHHHFAWFSVHYCLFNVSHTLNMVVPLMAIAAGLYKPEWKYVPRIVGISVAFMAVVYPVNKLLGTNYMFVNWAEPDTILVQFAKLAGSPGYVGVLIVFALMLISALYGLYGLIAWCGQRRALKHSRPR